MKETTQRYGIEYLIWALVESRTEYYGWTRLLNVIAMSNMNRISQKRYKKSVFALNSSFEQK